MPQKLDGLTRRLFNIVAALLPDGSNAAKSEYAIRSIQNACRRCLCSRILKLEPLANPWFSLVYPAISHWYVACIVKITGNLLPAIGVSTTNERKFMNKKLMGISAACALVAGTGSFQTFADKVPVSQLPETVQKAIKGYSQGETLESVERETKDGQTLYQAEFKREGLNRRVTFAADGTIVPEKHLTDAITINRQPSMAFNDLPAAVQKTVKEQQSGREVADIDKEMWNGKAVYEVEFKEKGANSRLHIASDGSMVVDKDRKSGTYLGEQLSAAPASVQAAVKRTVSNAEIEDVDREERDGRVVYDVEVKQEGLNRHLKIAADGTVLSDSNQRDSRSIGQRVRDTVGLGDRDASAMTLEQLPAAAQKTIRENCDVGTLKPIKREVRNGRTQYDVEFEKEGKNLRLTVGDDGTILKDNK